MQFYLSLGALFLFSHALPVPGLGQLLPLGRKVSEACLGCAMTTATRSENGFIPLTRQAVHELDSGTTDLGIIGRSVRNVDDWFAKNKQLKIAELKRTAGVGRFIADRIDPATGRPLKMSEEEFAKLTRRPHSNP